MKLVVTCSEHISACYFCLVYMRHGGVFFKKRNSVCVSEGQHQEEGQQRGFEWILWWQELWKWMLSAGWKPFYLQADWQLVLNTWSPSFKLAGGTMPLADCLGKKASQYLEKLLWEILWLFSLTPHFQMQIYQWGLEDLTLKSQGETLNTVSVLRFLHSITCQVVLTILFGCSFVFLCSSTEKGIVSTIVYINPDWGCLFLDLPGLAHCGQHSRAIANTEWPLLSWGNFIVGHFCCHCSKKLWNLGISFNTENN